MPDRAAMANRVVGALEAHASRILFCLPTGLSAPPMEVVAFPGDGVAWPSWPPLIGATGAHPHSSGLLGVLHDRLQQEGGPYANAALFVVEPRASRDRFALYDNLLPCKVTATGEPLEGYHGRGKHAAKHLAALIEAVYTHVRGAGGATPQLQGAPILAMGFSKGGIVLNELLAECSTADEGLGSSQTAVSDAAARLLSRLREVHYLDAGLASRGAHLTAPDVIEALGQQAHRPSVFFHGTPRQWNDPSRCWLREEKDRSAALLRTAGLCVHEHEYFAGEAPSLAMHFDCVSIFALGSARDCQSE